MVRPGTGGELPRPLAWAPGALALDRRRTYVPYVKPQENGGHAGVRWLELSDGTGGASVCFDRPRQVSATHFRADDLAAAKHDVELVARGRRRSSISMPRTAAWVLPSCGPDTLPEYLVGPGTYGWSWTIASLGVRPHR